jgi:hypothetical protein
MILGASRFCGVTTRAHSATTSTQSSLKAFWCSQRGGCLLGTRIGRHPAADDN